MIWDQSFLPVDIKNANSSEIEKFHETCKWKETTQQMYMYF